MAGPIRIAILANGSQAKRELNSVGSSVSRLGKVAKSGLAVAGVAGLTAGLAGIVKSSVDAEAKYSTTMRLIQASTKASANQMSAMDKAAMELGANTAFSAGEAADAMLELAKAGLSTKTILGGGVAGTLQLAAAGGTDLGTAATIASNALNTFNLQGKDMAKVAAALAGGANASSASVESLGQGLQQVGPGATNAGLSLQETVAALSAFDAAGIKGSDAGTSLKTMLARLVPQTDKAQKAMEELGLDFVKGNGEFESLANIAGQLQKEMRGLSQAERTVAMNRIFGSDASRAATVLMKEGAKGVRDFTKATQDQNAAQEMADARMSGTAGAMERLSGAVETAQLRIGKELAPTVERLADAASENLGPALEGTISGAKELGSAVAPLAGVLKDVAGLALDVAGVVGDMPAPLRETAIQAGLAALVLPRLAAAGTAVGASMATAATRVRQLNAEMSYGVTRTQNLTAMAGRLGSVAKQAGGIGGIMALTSGLSEAREEGASFGSVMKGAAGGAGIGLMFGPIGALVGAGVGGGLAALTGAFAETAEEAEAARIELLKTQGFKNAKTDADSLAKALQGVINAYGAIPRAAVEASFTGEDGKLDSDIAKLRELGVSMDTIVSATMGRADAQKVVDAALTRGIGAQQANAAAAKAAYDDVADSARDVVTATGQVIKNGDSLSAHEVDLYRQAWLDAKKPVDELNAAQQVFGSRVEENTGAIANHQRQVQTLAGQLGITVERYNKFPKKVRTSIEAKGLPQTGRDAARLINQYKGLQNFRSIKAVVAAPGATLTKKQIENLQRTYQLTPKQVRTLFRLEGVKESEGEARRGGRGIAQNLKSETGKAKADLGGFNRSVASGASTARGTASSGGQSVGNALQAGMVAGFAGTASILAAQASAAVRAAVAAGRAAGKINSPSKETEYIGEMLGEGLVVGLSARYADTEESGKNLILSVLAGVTGGSDAVGKSLDKLTRLIEKKIKRKKDKAEERAEKKALKAYADEYAALRKVGRAHDANAKKLEDSRQTLEGLKEAAVAYAAGIQSSFADFGNLINLGNREMEASNPWAADATAGGRSLGTILEDLRTRSAEATEFTNLMTSLQASGLNGTTVQQLLAAGPEAALSTAQAIASGGAAAVTEINSLTATIGTQGEALGSLMADQFHGAGIRAAEGIVAGFVASEATLAKAAKKLARTLSAAVRKELGINSPSRVFREIGDNTIAGLSIGLDNTYVKRQGQTLARDLTTGFGTPALDAYMATPGAVTAPATEAQALIAEVSAMREQMDFRMLQLQQVMADSPVVFGKTLRGEFVDGYRNRPRSV